MSYYIVQADIFVHILNKDIYFKIIYNFVECKKLTKNFLKLIILLYLCLILTIEMTFDLQLVLVLQVIPLIT